MDVRVRVPLRLFLESFGFMNIDVTCWKCNTEHLISVEREAYESWQNGELIQDALFMLSADQREMLLSGTCGECWDKLFPNEDEDIEEEL